MQTRRIGPEAAETAPKTHDLPQSHGGTEFTKNFRVLVLSQKFRCQDRASKTSRISFPRRKFIAPRAHASVRRARKRRRQANTTSGWNFSATPCCNSSSPKSSTKNFPTFDEGALTKSRAKLVNRTDAGRTRPRARPRRASDFKPRRGNHGGRERASTLADAFEALLGAIFLDGGFDAAREFILREFAADFGALAGCIRH